MYLHILCALALSLFACRQEKKDKSTDSDRGGALEQVEETSQYQKMLNSLKTSDTVVYLGSNVVAVSPTTNSGISYFYNSDMTGMLSAAQNLKVRICTSLPNIIATPKDGSMSEGKALEEVLKKCNELAASNRPISIAGSTNESEDQVFKKATIVIDNAGAAAKTSGVNYFYEDDVQVIIDKAIKYESKLCFITPKSLARPKADGPPYQTPGIQIEEALNECAV